MARESKSVADPLEKHLDSEENCEDDVGLRKPQREGRRRIESRHVKRERDRRHDYEHDDEGIKYGALHLWEAGADKSLKLNRREIESPVPMGGRAGARACVLEG